MKEVVKEAEIVNAAAENPLLELERASIDMQVATAHKFPRSLARFKENALALVTLDEETAASCLYRRPVGKDMNGREQYAEGMSIRMAEIVAGCYGNLRVGTRTIESTQRYVVVQGVAHDLETNFLSTAECKEATVKRNGQPYDERMRIMIEKAAAAKARRDAIFAVVPRASAKFLEKAAKDLLFGNASSITKWRDRIAGWVKTLGIEEKRVWNALGIEGAADLKQSEIEMLIGIQNALKSGDTTLDEAFPEIEKGEGGGRYTPLKKKEAAGPLPEKVVSAAAAVKAHASGEGVILNEGDRNNLKAIGKRKGLSEDEMSFLVYDVAGVNGFEKIPAGKYDALADAFEKAVPGKVLPREDGDTLV